MFNKFLPETLCLKMIQDETLSHEFRSCLVDFYIAGYLEGKSSNIEKNQKFSLNKQGHKASRFRIKAEDFDDKYIKVNEEVRISVVNAIT